MTLDKATVMVKISQAYKEKFIKIKESENIPQVKLIEKLIDIYDDYQELKSKSAQIEYEELDYNDRQGEKSDKYCITKGIASIWVPGICC